MPTSMLSSNILRYNDEKGMSREEIIMLAGQLIVAGSETTATALSGAIFQLLQHPVEMKKLTEEIRTFTNPEDMSFAKLAILTYLNACLTESLRLYPPVPEGLPRTTAGYGSLTINGHFIAENVSRLPF
jgi:cytochrome P450